LYVTNYVRYNIKNPKVCRAVDGSPDYCSPLAYNGISDGFYKNQGGGSFETASTRSGIANAQSTGLGVISADFNNDGNVEASMGITAEDYDNDGDVDLFMTHLNRETNTLYINNGKGWFQDITVNKGLAATSLKHTGFGTGWFDFNNDGYLDLFSANGGVVKDLEQAARGEKLPLKESNQLWLRTPQDQYVEISHQQGRGFLRPDVSRGAAFGDIDNDGDIDIVVTNNSGPPQILIKQRCLWGKGRADYGFRKKTNQARSY